MVCIGRSLSNEMLPFARKVDMANCTKPMVLPQPDDLLR
jgi:hypothetical protein